MKQQGRIKMIEVTYKGWRLKQIPWNSWEGKQYAKLLYDPDGKQALHAGYSKYKTRKQLRLMIRNDVNNLIPMLVRKREDIVNDNEDDDEEEW